MANLTCGLITGASSGIGECFARKLAARRTNLVLVARSGARLAEIARELEAAYRVQAHPVACDLSQEGAAARLVESLDQRGVQVDLLVNNAGFGARGEFWKLPLSRQVEMIRLNVAALTELTHWLAGRMAERRQGAIINVSSTAGFQPVPYTAVYAATKAFVTSFSLALEAELRPYRVRVVTLCPGGTKTNFLVAGHYGMQRTPGGLQDPNEVVEAALARLDQGGGLEVPRLLNKLTVFIQRFVPRRTVIRLAAGIFRPEGNTVKTP
jgi:short-subunit dehydrogenase